MESKIKKRALTYGIAAVLCVVVLGAISYNVGFFPQTRNLTPNSVTTPGMFATFSSYDALKSFLMTSANTWTPFQFYGPSDVRILSPSVTAFNAKAGAESFTFDHSSTNVQVAGIDESDFVKTDGEYIYLLSGNVVSILKAYPPESTEIVSRISFGELYPLGIFVNGDRLVVLGSQYFVPTTRSYYGYYDVDIKTFIRVYDISNRDHPVLLHDLMLSGSYFNSRMMEDYLYFVVSQPAYIVDKTVILPKIYSGDWAIKEIVPTEIHYTNHTDNYQQFTTFVAMNIQNMTEAPTYLTIMLGSTSNMYVSTNNMYVTYPDYGGNTTIYRVHIQANNISCEASGEVSGHELDQFSMDEYDDHFRIVTTDWASSVQKSNLYVLDMNMSIVGKLENLGVTENLHSTRFMGDRCYLVTFKKTDPLFVINLTEPTNPTVLGELKIPGYSDYLHPYDEDHIIGVGKETVEAVEGEFAWYQGVKISLFDVSNVSNPLQMANYIIGDRGTDTPVLWDHKAFLFDKAKDLLVLPVLVAEIDPAQYPYGVPPYAYGTPVWQGVYVLNITLTNGITFRGRITHIESGASPYESSYQVERALYIENVLYTISDKKVKLNNLEDLTLIKEITIP
ncbi:hypothetical protein A3K79_07305 [Candidatus Bathyarchaeota archaeon RBG_13_46_16b]|nr:MAG: hypothetical protein A3K79_07305 [Candidatus Bathyarchaeota archaeon RBG_13_46_16b]